LTFSGAARVMGVVLDPDGALALLETPVTSAGASEEEIYRAIDRMPWTGSGETARALLARVRECEARSAPLWAKLGLALYDGAHYLEALDAFRQAAERSADTTERTCGWVWQGHLLDLLGRREEALAWYRKAREAGFNGVIHHDQYGIVLDARWIEERLRAPFERVGVRVTWQEPAK
jgi:tetratricopeptide (TPR) repeat protein